MLLAAESPKHPTPPEGFRLGKRFPLSQKLRCYRVSKAPYSVDEDEEEQEQQQQEQQQEQEQEQE